MPASYSLTNLPQFPTSDARPSRERQVTSRRKWRQGLPQGMPAAANDNDPPVARPITAKREMDLEAMLGWTFRLQRAHQIIQEPIDVFLWMADQADLLTNPADRRPLHVDALIVHEAVRALGTETAMMVIQAACLNDWPQWMDIEECRPYPVEPRDRYEDHGWYVDADGKRAEYVKKTFEYVSIPKEEWEAVGRKKMKRTKADSNEKVPVDGCLVRWDPEPEVVEANNRLVAMWHAARPVLVKALRDAPFKDHILADDPVAAPLIAVANDNEAPVANDNEPIQAERVA